MRGILWDIVIQEMFFSAIEIRVRNAFFSLVQPKFVQRKISYLNLQRLFAISETEHSNKHYNCITANSCFVHGNGHNMRILRD